MSNQTEFIRLTLADCEKIVATLTTVQATMEQYRWEVADDVADAITVLRNATAGENG